MTITNSISNFFNPSSEVIQNIFQNFATLSLRYKVLTSLAAGVLGVAVSCAVFSLPVIRTLVNRSKLITDVQAKVRILAKTVNTKMQTVIESIRSHRFINRISSRPVGPRKSPQSLEPLMSSSTQPVGPRKSSQSSKPLKSSSTQSVVKNDQNLRIKTLENMVSGSFSKKLYLALETARQFTNSNQHVWSLATYYLFNESNIDEADCHPRLEWKGCDEKASDSFSSAFKNGMKITRSDALNDKNHQINALKLKQNMNLLSEIEKDNLCNALIIPNLAMELQPETHKIYDIIIEISPLIKDKYKNNIGLHNNVLSYIDGPRDMIHDILKNALLNEKNQLISEDLFEVLLDEGFSKRICNKIIIDLLSLAKIDGNRLIFNEHILSFEEITKEMPEQLDDIKNISLFEVNDLTSKNQLEEPLISDHALKIAQNLNKVQFHNSLDPEMQKIVGEFIKWIRKNYYETFCARFVRQLPIPKDIQIAPADQTASKIKIEKKGRLIANDSFGDHFMTYINKKFEVGFAWSLSGSCFLSCFIPESKGQDNYEGIMTARAGISASLMENVDKYLEFVEVIPDFSSMSHADKMKVKEINWVICEKNSIDSKRAAILARCAEILDSKTYLMDVEFMLTAKLLQTPIYIYKRLVKKFSVDSSGIILPHVVHGEEYKGKKPFYVLDDHDHYKPLNLRVS